MLNKLKPTIGIIDSGIGGVSILNQLISRFHAGNYIYFADNLYMPYGNKSKTALKERLLDIIKVLNNHNVDFIIIACNTASSVLNNIGIPNVLLMKFNKDDIYLATPLTKKSLPNCNVIADCSLAKQVEDYIFNEKALNKVVNEHVKKYKLNKLKNYTLACTHYELIENLFKKYCPNSKIFCNSRQIVNEINLDFQQTDTTVHIILSKPDFSYYQKLKTLIRI